jgi:hypothetical protein
VIHTQVLMALYSMEASGLLAQYRSLLPVYLSTDLERCETILEALAKAGLISRQGEGIELTYKVEADQGDHSCGCHAH